jgi:hypothetical protein
MKCPLVTVKNIPKECIEEKCWFWKDGICQWTNYRKVVKTTLLHSEILGVICCLIMIISVFLPWFYYSGTSDTITYFGYDGDPSFLLIFGILSLIFIYVGYITDKKILSGFFVFIFALFSTIVIGVLLNRMENLSEGYGSWLWGSYLGILGIVGLFISAMWQIRDG